MKSMWLVGLLAVCYAFNVQAVNINISGTVVATPCVVDLTSVNQTIDFGQLRATDFQNVQSAGEWRPFSLLLTNCPASTTQVTTTFTGNADSVDATRFSNSGTAKNAALQVTGSDHGQTYTNNSTMVVAVDAQRNATFPLSARVVSPAGGMTSGSFRSQLQITFSYQ